MRVLLFGARLGALRALSKRAELHVLSSKDPAPRVREFLTGFELVDTLDREDVGKAARRLFPEQPPGAVLACTEAGVLPAAWLREMWSLDGHHTDVAEPCIDKALMKAAVRRSGIACAQSHTISSGDTAESLRALLGEVIVVKGPRSSGSRGLRITRSLEELTRALIPGLVAESFVSGTEMSVEGFVHQGRIQFLNPTEYHVPAHANILPADLGESVEREIERLLDDAVRALQIERGMVHMELFLTEAGPVFGELAIRPPGGRIMRLLKLAWGFCPWNAALDLELGQSFEFPKQARRTAGTWILHPGAGRVARVEGLEAARALPGVKKIICRASPGDPIGPRVGTGQDIGFIDVVGESAAAVARSLDLAFDGLRVDLEPS